MASTTGSTGLHAVPTTSATASAAVATTAGRAWVGPVVAAAIGAVSGLAATWGIVATQTLHMSL
jgi:hypothetical protein